MKKILLFISVMFCITILSAQETEQRDLLFRKNEVKLNLPITIFASFAEASYERILSEDTSIGASMGVTLDSGDTFGYKYQFSPYFRWFFGGNNESARKYAAGFFLEANTALFGYDNIEKFYLYNETTGTYHKFKDDRVGFGLGTGFGWKYVSNRNWVGEILVGVGKNIAEKDGMKVYPRVGIYIGKRF